MSKCALCEHELLSHTYYENDNIWIADCKKCKIPLVVIKKHVKTIPKKIKEDLVEFCKKVFGDQIIFRWKMNSIHDHWHAHILGLEEKDLHWKKCQEVLDSEEWDRMLMGSGDVTAITPKVTASKKKTKKSKISNEGDTKKPKIKFVKKITDMTIEHAYAHKNKDKEKHDEIVKELEKLGYPHIKIDELDDRIESEGDSTDKDIGSNDTVLDGDYISLNEVLNAFPTSIFVDGKLYAAYLRGDIVKNGKIAKDNTIELVMKCNPDHIIVRSIKTLKPSWLGDMLRPVFEPEGDIKDNDIPVYRNGLFKTSKEDQTGVTLTRDIKPLDKFPPVENKDEYDSINDFYNNWASKYLTRGIIIQKCYDGYRFLVHRLGDNVKIISACNVDRTEDMPNIVKEIKEFKSDNFILDTRVLSHNTGEIELKSADTKDIACDKISKGRSKWILEGDMSKEQELSLVFYISDVLYLGDKSINDLGYYDRFNKIHEIIPDNSAFFKHVRSSAECYSPGLIVYSIKEFMNADVPSDIIGKVVDSKYPIKSTGNNKTSEWCTLRKLEELSDIEFKDCPYSKELWCPVNENLVNLSKEAEFPIVCEIANLYKCYYTKDSVYNCKGDKSEDN